MTFDPFLWLFLPELVEMLIIIYITAFLEPKCELNYVKGVIY